MREDEAGFTSRASVRLRIPAMAVAFLLAGCNVEDTAPSAPEIRPVRVITVEKQAGGETISLTGTIQAQTEVNLAFRIEGRMIERLVNVGEQVAAGEVVARLDPQNEENGLRSARADVTSLRGQLVEAENNYERQRDLLARGFATRVRYDEVTRILRTTQSQLDSAQAQLNTAENRLGYTELVADAPGTVTATGAEPGEVVQAGRMIVQIARQDGRDAVFDVPPQVKDIAPAEPVIEVSLTLDGGAKTTGRVREVSPRADPVTGTFQVRVGLTEPPAAMRLGSTVADGCGSTPPRATRFRCRHSRGRSSSRPSGLSIPERRPCPCARSRCSASTRSACRSRTG